MAILIEPSSGREALAFDDVLLQPGYSEVLPGEADLGTRLTRSIALNLPNTLPHILALIQMVK